MKEGGRAHAQAVPRRREAFHRGSRFTLGSIAAWLRWLLQYRRGGNRPITCRLLICSTQTAAVLPPMRKTRAWTLWLILSLLEDRLFSSLLEEYILPRILDRAFDPPWTHAAIFDHSPGLPRLRFSCSYSILLFDPLPSPPILPVFVLFFLFSLQLPTAYPLAGQNIS